MKALIVSVLYILRKHTKNGRFARKIKKRTIGQPSERLARSTRQRDQPARTSAAELSPPELYVTT